MTNESYRQVLKIRRQLEALRIYRQNQLDDFMKSRESVEIDHELVKYRQKQLDDLIKSRKSVKIDNELVKKVKELSKTDNNHGR